MNCGPKREGVFEQLRRIQMAVEVRLAAQIVTDTLVSFHFFAQTERQ